MKTIIMLAATLFASFNVSADVESAQDMLNNEVSQKPSAINLASPESYTAEGVSGYEGRNKNRATENLTSQVNSGNSISRSMRQNGSVKDSQLENLESTAGELVQKVEDDRVKKAKNHKSRFDSNKAVLQKTYDAVADVNVNQLGSEQDPKIQNAFKCSNIEECNKNPKIAKGKTDARAIKNSCAKNQRLHWDGSKWSCVGLFAKISKSSCSSRQYEQPLNGGVACIDYVYEWGSNSYTSCDASGNKQTVVKCFKKKKLGDANRSSVSDSECLGAKPESTTEQCLSSWTTGSWSACSKTCGGGVKTRVVTCPKGYKCTGARPATSAACNTNPCAGWKTDPWGGCSAACGQGSQVRNVRCVNTGISSNPTIAESYCTGTKPTSKQVCNLKPCAAQLTWKLSSRHSPLYRDCKVSKNPNKPHLGTKTVKCHGFSINDHCASGGLIAHNSECGDYIDALYMGAKFGLNSSEIGKACTSKGALRATNAGTIRKGSTFTSNTMFYGAYRFYECR